MEKRIFKTPTTHSIKNNGCDPEEIEVLCDIFERLILQQANSMLRKGIYDLKDFESARELSISDFTLTIERLAAPNLNDWSGLFEANGRWFVAIGSLQTASK